MTRHHDFKALVRARMAKTGERYTAARANLLGELARRAPPRARHDQTFSVRRLLDAADITTVQTGKSPTESTLLGLGGGVSFQYHAFQYKGVPPLVYIGTRCNPQYAYDARFVERAVLGLGLELQMETSTSARKAAAQLDAAVKQGPVLCWVGREALLGRPASGGATPWVVVVHDIDGEVAAVEDCAAGAMEVPLAVLAGARSAVKKQKHRIAAMVGEGPVDVAQGVRAGIRQCVLDLDGGVVMGGSAQNFGLAALEKWANLVVDERDAKGWRKLFGSGSSLLGGIRQTWAWVHASTGGGAFREMYAEFLRDAAGWNQSTALAEAATQVADNAARWEALVDGLFDGPPVLQSAKNVLHRCEDPTSPLPLEALSDEADRQLDDAFAAEFRTRLGSQLSNLVDGERQARSLLARAIA